MAAKFLFHDASWPECSPTYWKYVAAHGNNGASRHFPIGVNGEHHLAIYLVGQYPSKERFCKECVINNEILPCWEFIKRSKNRRSVLEVPWCQFRLNYMVHVSYLGPQRDNI